MKQENFSKIENTAADNEKWLRKPENEITLDNLDEYDEKITRKKREYFPEDFEIEKWEVVEKELIKMESEEIGSKEDLIKFIEKYSEFDNILSEANAWKYIKMSCHTDKEEYTKANNKFREEIVSNTEPYFFKFNKKIYESPYLLELPKEYLHMKKIISNDMEIFREENIPLFAKESELANKSNKIFSEIKIDFDGEERTFIQMDKFMENLDREKREKAWRLKTKALLEKEENFDKLFDELKEIRIQIAKNAGFNNYRDYMYKAMGRFDYTPDDISEFYKSIEKTVIPLLRELNEKRENRLGVEKLKPWDTEVNPDGKVLKPFETTDKLINGSVRMLYKVKPEFGLMLKKMENSGFLDLENRKGKAPGGYCYPLAEYNSSFIFTNAIGNNEDIRTMTHESGHGANAIAIKDIKVTQYKNIPLEIAELASQTMELFTLDNLDEFYKDKEDIKKIKKEYFEKIFRLLQIVSILDAFQQWIYTNTNHTPEERREYFKSLMDRFNSGVDWSGLDEEKRNSWTKQLHVFRTPFYMIEYAISQLGAVAIYKKYKENKKEALKNYDEFLKVGYSKSLKEVYETAGIKFDFSENYVREIVDFIKKELENLE